MTIARHYIMTAKPGTGDALRSALEALADAVRPLAGCEGVEMLRDTEAADRFVFIEKWASIDAHKSAASQLPKEAFGPMMATLAGRPDGSYLEYGKII